MTSTTIFMFFLFECKFSYILHYSFGPSLSDDEDSADSESQHAFCRLVFDAVRQVVCQQHQLYHPTTTTNYPHTTASYACKVQLPYK